MPSEPLPIFDPRRNFQLQGFTGRGATTTLHDAFATGVSISGILQAAEDFAVLGFYNAFDYFNHLRLKHLPRTDLSGLTLAFDIEYDHALDGAMRVDAAKYPSVSWDSLTFECGVGGAANTYEVRLLDYATVASGSETPAAANLDIDGEEIGRVPGRHPAGLAAQPERLENADCRAARLVGQHRERTAPHGACEFLADAGVRHRVIHQPPIVNLQKPLEGAGQAGIEPGSFERAPHQHRRAVADHGHHLRHRQRRRAVPLHELAGRLAEVARRIHQGAIQVKDYDNEATIIAA